MNRALSRSHPHCVVVIFVSILLVAPLLFVPPVTHAQDSGDGSDGSGASNSDSSMGADFVCSVNCEGGDPSTITCEPGWAPNPSGANECVETGYCGEYNYYLWDAHVCGGNCQQEMYLNPYQYRTLACPPEQTGQIDQYRGGYCPNPANSPPAWGEWITTGNTCHAPAANPTFTASPTAVLTGHTTTLTWSCPSPNTSSSGVNFTTGGAASGSAMVTVNTTTTYAVVCDQTHTQASAQVTTVNPALTFSASPTRVRPGQASVLTWGATSVTSCSVSGPSVTLATATADGNGNVTTRPTNTPAIVGLTMFTLTCQTSAGPMSSSLTIGVVPNYIEY